MGSAAFSPIVARILERARVESYLRVTRDPAAPLGRAAYEQIIRDYPTTRALTRKG